MIVVELPSIMRIIFLLIVVNLLMLGGLGLMLFYIEYKILKKENKRRGKRK